MSSRLLLAALCASAALSAPTLRAGAFNDTFRSFDATIWKQSTTIKHCDDGACFMARPDHIAYNVPGGITLSLNQLPCNASSTACCVGSKCAKWASGHVTTAVNRLYGTYEISAKPAHAAGSRTPPANAFSCWTVTYNFSPHNEIAICFSGSNSRSVHFSYWYDDIPHTTFLDVPFEFSAAYHIYKVVWGSNRIDFYIDGKLAHVARGTTKTIPFTAGYSALILRPKTNTYLADSFFKARFMSYDPRY